MTEPWWQTAFGRAYLEVYAHRDDASARDECAFAAKAMGLSAGSVVLDAACGAGRHARALAAAGFRVAGLDRSADLLAEAARRSPAARLVCGDLRALPFRAACCDGVVSFFTSFGYFDEAGDRAQLREVRRVLRRGGRHFLDFLNAPRVRETLVAASERAVGPWTVRETREIREGRVWKSVVVRGADVAWEESVRLWERDDVEAMLREAGLRAAAVHGDLAGAAWTREAPRLVIVSEAA